MKILFDHEVSQLISALASELGQGFADANNLLLEKRGLPKTYNKDDIKPELRNAVMPWVESLQPKSKIFSPSIRVIRSKWFKRVKGYRLEYPFLNDPRKSFHLGMFKTMEEAEAARDNMYRTLLQAQKHEQFGS